MFDRTVVVGMEKGAPEEATGPSTVVVLKLNIEMFTVSTHSGFDFFHHDSCVCTSFRHNRTNRRRSMRCNFLMGSLTMRAKERKQAREEQNGRTINILII